MTESLEFEKLVQRLELQLEAARKASAAEALRKKLKLVDGHLKVVDEKLAEMQKLGLAPDLVTQGAIKEMRDRKAAIEAELADLKVPAEGQVPAAIPVAPAEKPKRAMLGAEASQAITEIVMAAENAPRDLSYDDSVLLGREISLKWRIAAESIGNPAHGPSELKKGYAAIMTFREAHGIRDFYPALNRGEKMDWEAELKKVQAQMGMAANRKQESDDEILATLWKAVNAFTETRGDEERRKLFHAVRTSAKRKELRDEIAAMCRILKDVLQEEFAFLWDVDDEEKADPPKEQMTRLEIAQRIVRRMIRKGVIGGRHAPREMIHRGFPGNSEGMAVEFIGLLERRRAMIKKSTNYGPRSSLATTWVPILQRLVDGDRCGDEAVDKWCFEEEAS